MDFIKRKAKRLVLESLGWLCIVVGIAALVLPGPGLLLIFAGMALLATQYEWAERRLEPVRKAAWQTAAESVKTWPRIAFSAFISLCIVATGVAWGLHPNVPDWWPLSTSLWLPGGWATGGTLIASGLFALCLLVFSYRQFRTPR
ncbi:PGPGW domain-containing protein [Candidatus Saccharibacteria bacterium]|nr:PGPGW domain-containing protein [Candidatus Saccharibacteria bacterium]